MSRTQKQLVSMCVWHVFGFLELWLFQVFVAHAHSALTVTNESKLRSTTFLALIRVLLGKVPKILHISPLAPLVLAMSTDVLDRDARQKPCFRGPERLAGFRSLLILTLVCRVFPEV